MGLCLLEAAVGTTSRGARQLERAGNIGKSALPTALGEDLKALIKKRVWGRGQGKDDSQYNANGKLIDKELVGLTFGQSPNRRRRVLRRRQTGAEKHRSKFSATRP